MSPRSRGRKPKKASSSKRTSKRRSPAAGRATAVDPGYSGLGVELPRSPLDDVLLRHVRPDRFGPSHRRVLTASVALPRADGPRALEQATAELIGAELRNPEVQGLRFDLWAHDLIQSARNRAVRRRLEQRYLAGALVAAARARLDRLVRPWRVRRAARRRSREVPAACSAGAAAGLAGVDAGHRGDR